MKIRISRLHLELGGNIVLRDINLCMRNNGFNVLIGPNGSGKTSLLRVISGIYKPSSGEVFIEVKGDPRDEIFYLPSEPEAFPGLKVVDYLQIALGLRGLYGASDMSDVMGVLEDFEVSSLLGRDLYSLSSGERQRLYLAAAAASRRSVLLLDEPTSHLDIKWIYKSLNLLGRHAKDKLVVFTTHDINLASLYASHVTVLSKGSVVADGGPGSVLREDLLSQVYGVRLVSGELEGYKLFIPYKEG